jgi:hypothetical protein
MGIARENVMIVFGELTFQFCNLRNCLVGKKKLKGAGKMGVGPTNSA